MAVNVLVNSLLSLFGIDASSLSEEFGTIAVDLDDVSGGFDDIGNSATKAGKAAKEAQKSLRGFDKLNVIKTPTSASGGGGSVSGGGVGGLGSIDSSLLDKLGEYDLHLDQISNKATEIRDRIMEWLGFTKYIDPITGDISWEYEGIGKTLSNIGKTAKDLIEGVLRFDPIAIAAVIAIGKGLSTIYNLGKGLLGILGKTKLGGIVKDIAKETSAFFGIIKDSGGLSKGLSFWSENAKGIEKAKVAAAGLAVTIIGNRGLVDGMKRAIETGQDLGNTMEITGGVLASAAGGAMALGSIFGPWGAAIGGLVGGIGSLVEAMMELGERRDVWQEQLDASGKKISDFTQSLKEEYDQVEKIANQDMTKIIASETLVNELEKIVDTNGRVQKGYEDRANFIINQLNTAYGTEIKMIDGVIQEYDKQIKSIKSQIELQKAKIYQTYAEERYAIAIKNQTEAENLLNEALARQKGIESDTSLSTEERAQKLSEVNKQLNEARENIKKNQKAVMEYEKISEAIISGNENDLKHWEKQIQISMSNANSSVWEAYGSASQIATDYYKNNIELAGKSWEQLSEQDKAFVSRQLEQFTDMFEEGVKKTGEISDEMIGAWRIMAQDSEEAFIVSLSKLPQDLRQQVVNKMYPEGQGMSKKLQEGINSVGVTIKPKVIAPSAKELTNVASSIGSKIGSILTIDLGLNFKANGGLFSSGIWRPMKAYENGGFPTHGEIFMAREKGPELVGKIGNSTAVMNNNQILDQMTIAVARGMSASGEKERPVQIIAEGDTEGFMNFIKFKEISKNRQYGL